jgi:hypothetical protein
MGKDCDAIVIGSSLGGLTAGIGGDAAKAALQKLT